MIASAPGRVNLIGDHTDYTGGLVMPMAIDRWTSIAVETRDCADVELTSDHDPDPLVLSLPIDDPSSVSPAWGRYVAGVAAEMGDAAVPFAGHVSTDIPIGAGLSSSAALEVAAALALGWRGDQLALAQLCRRAEQRASGVPCGIMDQLCVVAGVAGHALLIDCHALSVEPVRLPDDAVIVVRFVAHRTLVGSAYADRVAQCSAAEAIIGPLRLAALSQVDRIDDPVVRGRARHVITENARVRSFADALRRGDLVLAGRLMAESHASLRDDFATSTLEIDDVVAGLLATPGVYGARMTGGGFGGCVVALATREAHLEGWRVQAVGGATTSHGGPS